MTETYNRIMAVAESIAEWEPVVRWASTMMPERHGQMMLVFVSNHHGGYESDHIPFLTPEEFLQRTEADLRQQLNCLLERMGMSQVSFRLMNGHANQTVAECSWQWEPDLILTTKTTAAKILGKGGFLGLLAPQPLPCALQIVPKEQVRSVPIMLRQLLQNGWKSVSVYARAFGVPTI